MRLAVQDAMKSELTYNIHGDCGSAIPRDRRSKATLVLSCVSKSNIAWGW